MISQNLGGYYIMLNEKFNLQLFAEPGNETGADVEDIETNNEDTDTDKSTYTQEEVEEMLQREADRRVTQALKKKEKEFEKRQAEAAKLREMDASQRKQYEMEKREKEIQQKEHEFAIMENKLECSRILSERGLDNSFVDYVVAEDAEQMMNNIETFEKAFKAAVADAVNHKITKKTPAGSASQKGMTKEEFQKLTLAQQSEIYRTNPALYKELIKK